MRELVLWGLPQGSTDRLDEHVLTCTTDVTRISRVKELASADGWHSFRVQVIDGTRPNFVGAINRF